jgi:hypothetical protein
MSAARTCWHWALGLALAAVPWPVLHAQMMGKMEIVSRFDHDGQGWLTTAERAEARAALNGEGRRSWGWGDASFAPATPGQKLTPTDVHRYGEEPLFDLNTLRTIFIYFDDKDWEQELADFYRTDVDVPATVIVDGQTYADVGVHFRGMTSFRMVDAGHKRSMDLAFDFLHKKQRLVGYRKLELLNSAADPTFLRSALYMHIMREYVPAPKVNYVRVVINGESWGVYVNEEHLTAEFTQDAVGYAKSMRWKVPGSPRARGGLEYLGDDPAPYRRIYEIKSADTPEAWHALIHLCKVLNTTPPEQLQAALAPLLDVDGALRFLAVDKALINNDGYWVRSSDYSIFTDAQGRFHVTSHDANETLRPTEEMGWGRFDGSPDDLVRPDSVELDPLNGARDPTKALLYRLLAVPELRARYLAYVRDVAQRWLDWNRLGPLAQRYQAVIASSVKLDTHKLYPTEAFSASVTRDNVLTPDGSPIAVPGLGLKSFAEQRRAYLLAWHENRSKSGT